MGHFSFLFISGQPHLLGFHSDLGISIDSKSAEKELKVLLTPEKSKTCVTAFTEKLVTTFQLSRTISGHFFCE